MKMKAAVLNETNAPFSIETVDLQPPQSGEVLVKMAASGVCHSDWHVVEGLSYFPLPIICGHEGAGVVEAVGDGVASVQPGDHVSLNFPRPLRQLLLLPKGQGLPLRNLYARAALRPAKGRQ